MAYKPNGFINKVKTNLKKTFTNVKKSIKQAGSKRQTRYLRKQTRKQARYKARQTTAEIKQAALNAEKATRRAKIDSDANLGGIKGWRARRLQSKIAAGDADVEMKRLKPKLAEKSAKSQIETEASVKRTKAQGAAFATAASALGGSYATKSVAESEANKAKAEADKAASQALQASLNTVPQVTTDDYSNNSVSGLVTGVR